MSILGAELHVVHVRPSVFYHLPCSVQHLKKEHTIAIFVRAGTHRFTNSVELSCRAGKNTIITIRGVREEGIGEKPDELVFDFLPWRMA